MEKKMENEMARDLGIEVARPLLLIPLVGDMWPLIVGTEALTRG